MALTKDDLEQINNIVTNIVTNVVTHAVSGLPAPRAQAEHLTKII